MGFGAVNIDKPEENLWDIYLSVGYLSLALDVINSKTIKYIRQIS